ncbi:4Fe-4S binding protein [Cyanobium sp. NIES-981]|uniref:4Fe-4S binding protein n=1 Tax=Cyanobium sp. NIES-981 TaxID=1851505 RepID=UPI0007DCB91F|nr:4Fe-4S binding protein [Cyanobium sp. NIES-981]SBO42044.1 4Fe-4S ferredoxin, iron-sulfur binding domain:Sigma-54 factor [Cyanobium sp. NIES-981]
MSSDPQDRLLKLAPHLVGRSRRGVVGGSRYARRLRDQIRAAAADPQRRPVLISGEPGLEKDNTAALIHFGSPQRRQLMLRLDGATLRSDGSTLFGPRDSDGVDALLDCLGSGSLLIDKVDQVPEELVPALLELAATGRWSAPGPGTSQRHFPGRLFFTAERALPRFDRVCTLIRVPPLRVRRQDLGEWLRYSVRLRARKLGWAPAPEVSEATVKRLQNHDFPNNLRELDEMVNRALQQCRREGTEQAMRGGGASQVLPEDVFWTRSRPARLRFDLWRWKPGLRDWMRAPQLWNTLLFGLVSWLFVLVNLWLWLGPQDRAHNGGLNLFWAWWWPLILLGYPLVGRLWCAFCPFMVWGEIAQRLARSLGWRPRAWPRGDTDRWAAPVLAAGFAAILLWEELADLENTAWLSSCLLLLITAGAVLGSLAFEKRFWCRHLCPVGGMNGLFAKLSVLELRAQAGTCSGSCSSYACFKGGPAEGEGLATAGCPLGTHPAHLEDNRNCVLCLTCAQACPHRSVQLRLRPPAADIQRDMGPPWGESGLILVLAGGVCLHHWQRLLGWWPLAPASLQAGSLLPRLAFGSLALAVPSLLFLALRPWLPRPQARLLLYALLPLLWGVLLARHLPLGMAEAGMLLPVSLMPLDASLVDPSLLGALPGWRADPHVVAFCQTAAVGLGSLGSLLLLRRVMRQRGPRLLLGSGAVLALSVLGRWLVAA